MGLTDLWLPILLSGVFVFIASSLIHMVFSGWHAGDYRPVPDQDRVQDALRPFNIPQGDYMLPRAGGMADMKTPEFQEKLKKGPVIVMTVFPNGDSGMGKPLALWFLFTVVVSIFAAYVAGRALGAGAEYLEVFRFAGTTAFVEYSLASWPMWIWYRRKLSTTIKDTIDRLIYGLITGGTFGWLWPQMMNGGM
ncbi:MAG: hypothetical protein L0Y80_04755 [Ignavibacteriae bacterium]|nr:hypothetical protein [Ignavibacteriota bacterium]